MDYISLGESCQTAHQIRRFSKNKNSYFYDWVSVRGDSYKAILLDKKGHFQEGNCTAVDKNEFSITQNKRINFGKVWVLDSYSKLHYQHEFELNKKSNCIDELKINNHLPVARSKFLYLLDKTIKVMSESKDLVLVRYENVKTFDEALTLAKEIFNTFYEINPDLKVLITSCLIDQDYIVDDKIFIAKLNKADVWSGDDDSWDNAFSLINKSNSVSTFTDYDFWKEKKYEYSSIDGLISNIHNNGLHLLKLSKISLDLLTKNSEQIANSEYIMITFSAAIARNNNYAPFFSLSGISNKLNIPLIAFSDPTLSLSKGLSLSWYAGNEYYPNLPQDISNICDKIVELTGKKILFVGGSGGGVASLNIQERMVHSSSTQAIVWNPQTDIYAYSPSVAAHYMKVAYSESKFDTSSLRMHIDKKIKSTLLHNSNLKRLILMDGYDYRHIRDLKVFFKHSNKIFKHNNLIKFDDTTVCFGDWGRHGNGHLQPPVDILSDIILKVFSGTPYEYIDSLITKTNVTNRKMFSSTESVEGLNQIRIFGTFFEDFFQLETNLPELFYGYDLSVRIVDKETREVIYWGNRQDYLIVSKEIIKLIDHPISQKNMVKYEIHLSIKDFFNNEKIIVKLLNYTNTKVLKVNKL